VTSYYEDNWGFCLSQEDRDLLEDGEYYINVNTRKFRGSLTYGELIIKGKSSSEIFFSTYICHPVMANNELSGPSLMTFISKFIETISNRRYTYRIIFTPETIGSIVYLNKHLSDLKKYVCAGFNVTCIGDNRAYSFLPSRFGNTLSDNVARHILKFMVEEYTEYDWRQRGSDERQYCSPGVDLPIASIMRSKYGTYPEYHTSLDTLGSVVTPEGLNGGFEVIKAIIKALENNYYVKYASICEPAMSKRNLYPTLSTRYLNYDHRKLLDLLYWADGKHTLLDIANLMNTPISDIIHMASTLLDNSLILINDQEF
jgi:aminopeptidase-like protein